MFWGLEQVVVDQEQVVGGHNQTVVNQERVADDHKHVVGGDQQVNMIVGMLGKDAQPIGQQILAISPIPKAAPRARNRQAQIVELLTSSLYKKCVN